MKNPTGGDCWPPDLSCDVLVGDLCCVHPHINCEHCGRSAFHEYVNHRVAYIGRNGYDFFDLASRNSD